MKIADRYGMSGKLVKDTEKYKIIDNDTLQRLTISTTRLYENEVTNGHTHKDQEEVYHFLEGEGEMILGEQTIPVRAGDVVVVPIRTFHKVEALCGSELYFMCVFEGNRNH